MDARERDATMERILGKVAANEALTPEEAEFLDVEAAIRSLPPVGRGRNYADADEAPRDARTRATDEPRPRGGHFPKGG